MPTCFDHLEDLEMSTNSQSKPLLWGGSTAKIHESMPQGTKCEESHSHLPKDEQFFSSGEQTLESVDIVNGDAMC